MMAKRKEPPENSRARNVDEIADRLIAKIERDAAEARANKKKVIAAPETDRVTVISPYGRNVDIVDRVIDTIEAMHKRGQLDDQQYLAAKTFNAAFEIVWGQAGGAMDFDRIRGAPRPGTPPPPYALMAADVLLDVEKLGLVDKLVVEMICGEGLSLGQCATKLGVDDRNIRFRLSDSLTQLGRKWHPTAEGGRSRIRAYLPPDSKPQAGSEGVISPGRTAHADRHKTYRRGR